MRTSDGDGVALYRSIGGPKIDTFSPFLLLDEFKSDQADDYIGGFPDHPHRFVKLLFSFLQLPAPSLTLFLLMVQSTPPRIQTKVRKDLFEY
jgi:hypothetical protein